MQNSPETIIIGTGIVIDVIKNDKAVLTFLRKQAEDNKLILPYSCVLEGLELAQKPTVQGIHALAELISMVELGVSKPKAYKDSNGPLIKLTPDVLLSCLLGIIKSKQITDIAKQASIVINDAFLVTSLLCVLDDDPINTQNLTKVLRKVDMELIDPATTDRKSWPEQLSEEAILRIRSKSLNAKPH